MSQQFSIEASSSYTLTTFAEDTPCEGSNAKCDVQLCVNDACGAMNSIGSTYGQYSYNFTSGSTETCAMATINIACSEAAYVGIDRCIITRIRETPQSATTVYGTVTAQQNSTVTQTVTERSYNATYQTQTVMENVTLTATCKFSSVKRQDTAVASTYVLQPPPTAPLRHPRSW